jgi:hypothetical protein
MRPEAGPRVLVPYSWKTFYPYSKFDGRHPTIECQSWLEKLAVNWRQTGLGEPESVPGFHQNMRSGAIERA